jgi:hypothetical protein
MEIVMTSQEYRRWVEYMKRCRGHWTLDVVHDGTEGRDLLLFCPFLQRPNNGVYICISASVPGVVEVGRFDGAVPHIGEALFTPLWKDKRFSSFVEAKLAVLKRTLCV